MATKTLVGRQGLNCGCWGGSCTATPGRQCNCRPNGIHKISLGGLLDQLIEITPGISGGKPRVAGRRITVQNIAIWHERLGRSADEIAAEYDLSLTEVYAALAYYFSHREEIDRSISESETFVDQMKSKTPSKIKINPS
jgi:uncharacterized protein (DUF433 family)